MQVSERQHVGFLELLRRIFCRLCEKWCPPPPPKRPDHFIAGQINLLAEHDKGLDAETIAKLAQQNPLLTDDRVPRPVIISSKRVITFEFADRARAFSLVFVDLPALREQPVKLVQLINTINIQINAQDRGDGDSDPKRQSDASGPRGDYSGAGDPAGAPHEGDRPRTLDSSTGEQNQSDALIMRRAAPNWLSSGAKDIGGGGPGARPVPPAPASLVANAKSDKAPWEFTLPSGLPQGRDGEDIEVAILDTAPDKADMDRAYTNWRAANPLIRNLFGPNGTLQVTYGGYSHLVQLADGFLNDHTYPMADHGVFVAGIIRALAPKAKLHLIEVLNPYGLGSIETIALGLQRLMNRSPDQPRLLVNCSLVINIPPADLLAALQAQDPIWREFDAQTLQESSEILRVICQELQSQGVFLFAAAGNDGDPNADKDNDPNTIPHPKPHYPAAFPSVTGVAALQADDTPAPYSDVCDDPPVEGMAVFGGDVDRTLNENADPIHGMLGVFTSLQYPDGRLNGNGWARWAGTSFATPALTGAVAALLGAKGIATPQDAITALRAIDKKVPTDVGESVHIAQG
ncbi:MAG TPA: S8 family serine peptidase [Roseiflexaceae bacterium]